MNVSDLKAARKKELAGLPADVRTALKKPMSIAELASKLDRGPKQIAQAIEELKAAGVNVTIAEEKAAIAKDLPKGGTFRIDEKLIRGNKIRFGAMGDTHLCSKYERLDVLNALYDRFQEEGITTVYHTGNMIEGRCRFNQFDILPGCESLDAQLTYNAKHYPQRKGITTEFIAGDDHEGWWVQREGVNIGQMIQRAAENEGRADLKYLSYMEADILIPAPRGVTTMRAVHPGGGSAYAISYTAQKLAESLQGGEKPAVQLIGHYHKMEYGRPREVISIQTGCTQDQTPFMRKKRLEAHLGGWIIELEQAPDGHVAGVTFSDYRFYDRKFYERKEKFRRW